MKSKIVILSGAEGLTYKKIQYIILTFFGFVWHGAGQSPKELVFQPSTEKREVAMRNAIAILCLLALAACNGPETVIKPVEYRDSTNMEYSEICVYSNVATAPFAIIFVDFGKRLEGRTDGAYECEPLNPGRYQVEFLDVEGWQQTPPIADDLDLKKGQGFEITGFYAK